MEQAFTKLVSQVIAALDDGWQPGQDIPVIVKDAIDDFWPLAAALIKKVIEDLQTKS